MLYLTLVTPLFGLIRNYVKYKKFNYLIFIRTPIIYLLIQLFIQTNNIWKILMIERWILFIVKISKSIYLNDYIRKKHKYIKKYGFNYEEKVIVNKLSPMDENENENLSETYSNEPNIRDTKDDPPSEPPGAACLCGTPRSLSESSNGSPNVPPDLSPNISPDVSPNVSPNVSTDKSSDGSPDVSSEKSSNESSDKSSNESSNESSIVNIDYSYYEGNKNIENDVKIEQIISKVDKFVKDKKGPPKRKIN